MMFRGFRDQYTFPNMQSIAMLNENSYEIGGKNRKKERIFGDDIGGLRVQYAFPNMETFAFLNEKWL